MRIEQKYGFAWLIIFSFTMFSCEVDPAKLKGEKVKFIKKEMVYTESGKEIDLGGDSIKKVYYIIRHAEKDTQKIDPPLSKIGNERKVKLNRIFKNSFLDAVYSTLTSRTIQTVDSVAQYKGLSYHIYTDANAKETFNEISKSVDKNKILIVGHSNTVPPIANFLYGKKYFNSIFPETEYDNLLIIVERTNGSKQIYELKY